MASLTRNSVDRSANALGLGFKGWTRNDLSLILSHYRVRLAGEDSKNTLIDKLNQLALERGLTSADRLAIVRAYKAGRSLPPRKPLLRGPIASATVPQIAAISPATSHLEEVASDTNEGSDTDMSDGEDTEELQTLSEEEKDLREYTHTMDLPQNSGKHRMLRPRPAVSKAGNSPMPVNRPLMENRLATVNDNAPILPSNVATVNRAGTGTHLVSNRLARPRTVEPAPMSQPRTEPSTSQIIDAINHECLICYDSFDPVKSPMRQPTSSCTHEVSICKPCLSASISSQLESKLWTGISCPVLACDEILGYDDIKEFAEPQIFAR